jgi:hypothetical protein
MRSLCERISLDSPDISANVNEQIVLIIAFPVPINWTRADPQHQVLIVPEFLTNRKRLGVGHLPGQSVLLPNDY